MRARVVMLLIGLGCVTSIVPREVRADEPAAAGEADSRERSRVAFRKGVAQLRAQDWAAARTSFESALALYPHPSILLNLGIARLRTDDPVRAEQDLMRFLSEDVGASPDELASAREALADARSKLGTLRVVVSPAAARVAVDGKAVETVRRADSSGSAVVAEVRAKPGRHVVAVEAEGHTPDKRDVEVVAKGEASIAITLAIVEKKPVESGPATRSVVGWSMVGLGGAALITAGFTALRAKSLANEYADTGSTRYQDSDARSEGVTFRTAADVALGVALLSGVAAVILLLTDLGKGPADVARPRVLRW